MNEPEVTEAEILSKRMELEQSDPVIKGGVWQQVFAAFSVSYLCISAGNFLGYTSTAIPSMRSDPDKFANLTHHDISWIGSLSPLGAMCGSVLATIPISHLGARNTVAVCATPLLIGSWLTIAFSRNIYYIFVGRFLGGLGSGVAISSAPLYVIETASDNQRGRLGILPQFLLIFGIWLSNVLGSIFPWRSLAIASMLITLPSIVLMFFAPNSPVYYITRNKLSDAIKCYRKLRGLSAREYEDNVESETKLLEESTEFQSIVDEVNSSRNDKKKRGPSRVDIPTVKACAVALGLMSFQQLTGINGVTFYAVTIFKETPGAQTLGPYLPAIFLASVQCIAVFISTCFVERLGRKILLLISATMLSTAAASLSMYFYLCWGPSADSCENFHWVPLVFLICFVFAFAIGYGPLCWIVVTEILPSNVRNLMNPITIGYSWFCVFLVTKSFPILMVEINLFGIFALFGAVGIISIFFIAMCVPETKGKSLQQIQTHFGRK